jgi:hypothetical protein
MSAAKELYPRLLDPEALNGPSTLASLLLVRNVGTVCMTLNNAANRTANTEITELPASVIIDARNNPQGIDGAIATARNMRLQDYGNPSAIRVAAAVDFASFDPSHAQRTVLNDLGVEIQHQGDKSNNAEGINETAFWTSEQNGLTVVMRAGNRFATDQALRAASYHIGESDAAGAYGPRVMDRNASLSGMIMLRGNAEYFDQYAEVEDQSPVGDNGFLSAAGAAFQTELLVEAPLDTRFGRGGATRYWGQLAEQAGYHVVYDPAMAVHDSSGASLDQILEEATWHTPNSY